MPGEHHQTIAGQYALLQATFNQGRSSRLIQQFSLGHTSGTVVVLFGQERLMSMMRSWLSAFCLGIAATSRITLAQTVGGQVVDLSSGKPVAHVRVALVSDSAKVLGLETADTIAGVFYLDAPRPGTYRVAIVTPDGHWFVSPRLTLDSGQTLERKFEVPHIDAKEGAYFAMDVDTVATLVFRTGIFPHYPYGAHREARRARVSFAVVIDTTGHADMSTYQPLNDVPGEFATPVRQYAATAQFLPAWKDGHRVRQVWTWTIDFGFVGDPDVGDMVVRVPKNN